MGGLCIEMALFKTRQDSGPMGAEALTTQDEEVSPKMFQKTNKCISWIIIKASLSRGDGELSVVKKMAFWEAGKRAKKETVSTSVELTWHTVAYWLLTYC